MHHAYISITGHEQHWELARPGWKPLRYLSLACALRTARGMARVDQLLTGKRYCVVISGDAPQAQDSSTATVMALPSDWDQDHAPVRGEGCVYVHHEGRMDCIDDDDHVLETAMGLLHGELSVA